MQPHSSELYNAYAKLNSIPTSLRREAKQPEPSRPLPSFQRTDEQHSYASYVLIDQVKKYFRDTATKELGDLMECKFPPNISSLLDDYGNTLLHIASIRGNVSIIKYLINKGFDKHKKNLLNLTPWELVLKNQKTDAIQAFIDNDMLQYKIVKNELDAVRADLDESKRNYDNLVVCNNVSLTTINDLTGKISGLHSEISVHKSHNKRLRDDNDLFSKENVKLTEDNKRLKTSISSLISSQKK